LEGDPPMTDHFFDQPVPQDGYFQSTPLWDSLLRAQIECAESRDFVEAMIGRLFFPIGLLDNWQLCLFFVGDSNTGKSTLA
jgi:hypothetical protein